MGCGPSKENATASPVASPRTAPANGSPLGEAASSGTSAPPQAAMAAPSPFPAGHPSASAYGAAAGSPGRDSPSPVYAPPAAVKQPSQAAFQPSPWQQDQAHTSKAAAEVRQSWQPPPAVPQQPQQASSNEWHGSQPQAQQWAAEPQPDPRAQQPPANITMPRPFSPVESESSESTAALAPPPPAAASMTPAPCTPPGEDADPWSVLQYKYGAGSAKVSAKGPAGQRHAGAKAAHDDDDDVIMVEDGPGSRGQPLAAGRRGGVGARSAGSQLMPKPELGMELDDGIKAGGWGNGALAAAGTLMLGEESRQGMSQPPQRLAPLQQGSAMPRNSQAHQQPTNEEVQVFDDLEAELQNLDNDDKPGMDAGLASKLAAFEAMQEDYD